MGLTSERRPYQRLTGEDSSVDHRSNLVAAPLTDPIAAVTHPDPYPYYRALAERGPIQFDPQLHLWVVTGYAAISDVLRDPGGRTRPATEPVPAALVGTATGKVFGRMVRMTDGPRSRAVKHALQQALTELSPGQTATLADRTADGVLSHLAATNDPDGPTQALFAIPVTVMAILLGFPELSIGGLIPNVRRFAAAIAPSPRGGSIEASERSTPELVAQVGELVDRAARTETGLLGSFIRRARLLEPDWREVVVANTVGLLFQSLDATAGLIGNSLRVLAAHPDLRAAVLAEPARLDGVVLETLRYDPPIQNTRRFAAAGMTIAGQDVGPGETLLLIIAAANRDPAVFADPDRFAPERAGRESLSFGVGAHRCPGQRLAWDIAVAGVRHGLRRGFAEGDRSRPSRFIPSPNARIPSLTLPRS